MATSTPVLLWRLLTTVRNWPVYLLNRFGRCEAWPEVRLTFWNGLTMIGRPKSVDRCICNEEWLDRCYEPHQAGIPFDWASAGTIIDIGGHIGGFTLYAAAHAPRALVIAYEPEPSNAQMLRRNVEVNGLQSRITVEQKAVGGQAGTLNLHRSFTASGSGGHSVYDYSGKGEPVPVDMVTLEQVFAAHRIDRCDFLKIDCEGTEYEMLYGLPRALFDRIGFIALEYHHFSKDPRHTPQQLQKHLESVGFTVMEPSKSLFFAYRA